MSDNHFSSVVKSAVTCQTFTIFNQAKNYISLKSLLFLLYQYSSNAPYLLLRVQPILKVRCRHMLDFNQNLILGIKRLLSSAYNKFKVVTFSFPDSRRIRVLGFPGILAFLGKSVSDGAWRLVLFATTLTSNRKSLINVLPFL